MVGESKKAERSCNSSAVAALLSDNNLHTVCSSARCPNRGECFSSGEATFMILGDVCTRACAFCAVGKGACAPPDPAEAQAVARAAAKMNLKYAVITSPTRDDLSDGGASAFRDVVLALKAEIPGILTEILTPDFQGSISALESALSGGPSVFAHNIETVPSLYSNVRAGADFARSVSLLKNSKKIAPSTLTKSGIMLGLGEREEELKRTISALAAADCDILTLGQYLSPSKNHFPVSSYPEQSRYDKLKEYALSAGFKAVAAGPLVRSSYKAGALYTKALKNI